MYCLFTVLSKCEYLGQLQVRELLTLQSIKDEFVF